MGYVLLEHVIDIYVFVYIRTGQPFWQRDTEFSGFIFKFLSSTRYFEFSSEGWTVWIFALLLTMLKCAGTSKITFLLAVIILLILTNLGLLFVYFKRILIQNTAAFRYKAILFTDQKHLNFWSRLSLFLLL